MKCSYCNKDIISDAEFCPYCGKKITSEPSPIKKVSLKCSSCGGVMEVDSDEPVLYCPYCGAKEMIIETDAVATQRIKSRTYKEVELTKLKSEEKKIELETAKQEKREEYERISWFRHSRLYSFLIIAFIISCLAIWFCIKHDRYLAAFLSVLQAGCFATAWCLGMQIIKETKPFLHTVAAVVGVIMILPILISCARGEENVAEATVIDWDVIQLKNEIPEPSSKNIKINSNTERELRIEIKETTQEDYYRYIKACKELGYVREMTELSSLFNAYNDQGSELDIYYFESKKTMDVNYKVLPQMSDISWKDHSIADFLPEPPSSMGKFTYERSDEVEVLLSGLTSQDFTDYCTRCKEMGFVIDIEYDNDQYSAYNDDGYQVEVFFWSGRTTMEIRFSWPIQFGEIDWPNRGIGSLLPKPDSTLANVSYDSSNFYAVYVSMTPEEYCWRPAELAIDKSVCLSQDCSV